MTSTVTTMPWARHFGKSGFSSPRARGWATRGGRQRRLSSVDTGIVGDANRRRAFRKAIADVLHFQSLPEDWNGEGGLPACPAAVDFARWLLECLESLPDVCPPFVCAISTGVFLQWQSGDTTLYFEVDDESVLWMIQKGDVVQASGEDSRFDVDRAYDLVARFHGIDTVPADGITQDV